MSRLDRLFGPRGDGSSGIGSDAELVSLLTRIVGDIERLKRGAYRGPGSSFKGPLIIDDFKLEFINEALVATNIYTNKAAQFGTSILYNKVIFIGDEFVGFNPNTSTWGSSPYGSSGNRWQDMISQTYNVPVSVDGTVLAATVDTLLASPRVASQASNLLIICVGSHDMLIDPTTIPAGETLTNVELYRDRLVELAGRYPSNRKIIVFPWSWAALTSGVNEWPDEYSNAANDAAILSYSTFLDLNQLTFSSSWVVNAASTTNSTPSLDGNQVIFAELQAILDA